MSDFFAGIPAVTYEGPDSTSDFAFRHYNPDEVVMGKRMEDHLRFAVAWWHSFAWEGGDPFGGQTFERPWFGPSLDHAKAISVRLKQWAQDVEMEESVAVSQLERLREDLQPILPELGYEEVSKLDGSVVKLPSKAAE